MSFSFHVKAVFRGNVQGKVLWREMHVLMQVSDFSALSAHNKEKLLVLLEHVPISWHRRQAHFSLRNLKSKACGCSGCRAVKQLRAWMSTRQSFPSQSRRPHPIAFSSGVSRLSHNMLMSNSC